jgi:protein PET100
MYLAFPIGWMYYFGTNLDERFKVPEFWPTQEQSHKLPYDKEDIKAEIDRMNRVMREREQNRKVEKEWALDGSPAGLGERRRKGVGEGG